MELVVWELLTNPSRFKWIDKRLWRYHLPRGISLESDNSVPEFHSKLKGWGSRKKNSAREWYIFTCKIVN